MTMAGVIHEYEGHKVADYEPSETEHHHKVEHKHAESHQSVKFIHYHAVPVYVKKEDQKYLAHPVEIGSNKHKLKLIHPEAQHAKGYGLTLENHSEFKNLKQSPHYEKEPHSAGSHSYEHVAEEHQKFEEQPSFDFAAYEAAHHH